MSRIRIPEPGRVLILGAWSVLMLGLWASGRLDLYLHPMFRPWVGVAGGVLGLMVAGLCLLPRAPQSDSGPAGAPCDPTPTPTVTRRRSTWWELLILVVPAYAAAVLSPQGYSLEAVLKRGISKDAGGMLGLDEVPHADIPAEDLPLPVQGTYSPVMADAPARGEEAGEEEGLEDFFKYVDQSPDGAWRLDMLDLVYAAEMAPLRKTLGGRKVELTGQLITRTPGATAERFSLVRLLMVCCAADARPVGVWIERTQGSTGFKDMDWVRVVGQPTFPVRNGRRTVVVQAERIEASAPPDEWFLFQ